MVSASEFPSPAPSSFALEAGALGRRSLEEESDFAALDDLAAGTVLDGSESPPGRFGEAAAGFVEAGSTAFCASMSFNSKTDCRCAPSWLLLNRGFDDDGDVEDAWRHDHVERSDAMRQTAPGGGLVVVDD